MVGYCFGCERKAKKLTGSNYKGFEIVVTDSLGSLGSLSRTGEGGRLLIFLRVDLPYFVLLNPIAMLDHEEV